MTTTDVLYCSEEFFDRAVIVYDTAPHSSRVWLVDFELKVATSGSPSSTGSKQWQDFKPPTPEKFLEFLEAEKPKSKKEIELAIDEYLTQASSLLHLSDVSFRPKDVVSIKWNKTQEFTRKVVTQIRTVFETYVLEADSPNYVRDIKELKEALGLNRANN